MKKIVFALIAVLLIGTFVACDGETDFLLWEDEPAASKFLKLKIIDGELSGADFSFVGGTEKVVEIKLPVDDSVKTWQDLIDHSFEIPLYEKCGDAYSERDFSWYDYGDYVMLVLTGSFYECLVTDTENLPLAPLAKTAEIDFDSQYILVIMTG